MAISSKAAKKSGKKTANENLGPDIVHESEVQRQHIRVKIRAKAQIGGKIYDINNLSPGGFQVTTEKSLPVERKKGDIRIVLPFETFTLQFGARARQIYHNSETETSGLQFTELNTSQISLINYMVKSCLAGHIISEGDIISIVSRDNFTKTRQSVSRQKQGLGTFLKRVIPVILILGIGAASLMFLSGNLFERTAVIKSYHGQVRGEQISVRTFATGLFRTILDPGVLQVSAGQPIGVIEPATHRTGEYVKEEWIIKSPCDCYIVERLAKDGEFRSIGEPIFSLTPIASAPMVTTLLPAKDSMRLRLQDDVNINIAGEGVFIPGYVDSFRNLGSASYTSVNIRPKDRLPVEMIGRPAYVEFLAR